MALDLTTREPFSLGNFHEQFDLFLIDMENMPNQEWNIDSIKKTFDVDDRNAKELLFQYTLLCDAEEFDRVALTNSVDYSCGDFMNRYGLCWYLSKLLVNRKIELEDDSYFTYINMLKESKLELSNLFNSLKESQSRFNLFNQEYYQLFQRNSAIHFMSEYKITKYLNDNNEYFDNLGYSSYLQLGYLLKMHNINVEEHEISEIPFYDAKNRYIHIRVGSQNYGKIIDDIKNKILSYPVYPVIHEGEEEINTNNNDVIKQTELCILLDDCILCWARKIKFNNKEVYGIPCDSIGYKTYVGNQDKIIRIIITSNPYTTLLNHLKKKLNYSFNYSNDLNNLKDLITRGCYNCFPKIGWKSIKQTLFDSFRNVYSCENIINAYAITMTNLPIDSEVLTRDDLYEKLNRYLPEGKANELSNKKYPSKQELESYIEKIPDSLISVMSKGIILPTKVDVIRGIQKAALMAELIRDHPEEFYSSFIKIAFGEDVLKDGMVNFDKCGVKSTFNKTLLRKVIEEYHFKINKRMVGPFFIIDGRIVAHLEPIDSFPKGTEVIDSDLCHFDFYNEIKKEGMKEEYSMYPRGRVLYNVKKNLFRVFVDKTIIENSKLILKINEMFNIGGINVSIETDEHYQVLTY